ncbi:MAG TPA: bifunctional 2-polyprenyl-6-hydroxyphenol methylase/3-demethylubiquinol 3-O-methyltransferase UbiG [Candidatus Azoamicus sp. MARI]
MSSYFLNIEINKFFLKKNFFKPLYLLNDIRFNYILKRIKLKDKFVLDIGCGIGLLSEKIALHGGVVTGIDKSDLLIKVAFNNSLLSKLNITYECFDFLSIKKFNFKFDIIICTEVIEHLDDILKCLNFIDKVSKKDTRVFISSLNKTLLSYFKIIFLGDFLSLSLIKNTHKYEQFIDSYSLKLYLDELGFIITDIKYLNYNFLFEYSFLQVNCNINYLFELIKIK